MKECRQCLREALERTRQDLPVHQGTAAPWVCVTRTTTWVRASCRGQPGGVANRAPRPLRILRWGRIWV